MTRHAPEHKLSNLTAMNKANKVWIVDSYCTFDGNWPVGL